jgi:hypothetical protein
MSLYGHVFKVTRDTKEAELTPVTALKTTLHCSHLINILVAGASTRYNTL